MVDLHVRTFIHGILRERSSVVLLSFSIFIAIVYLASIFDPAFLLGHGPFWANPRGPWLMDTQDRLDSLDVLSNQVGYLAWLRTGWHLPLFFVPDLGTPSGTNIIFVDAIPVAALVAKVASIATATAVNPYGFWTGLCFILSAVFASLVLIEAGQRSLLAVAAASLLALSAPTFLHRFGHLALMGHFLVIGALWLYLRDLRVGPSRARMASWTAWLCLALLINPYLFAMAGAIYAAAWLRRFQVERAPVWRVLREPLVVAVALVLVMAVAGHFGKGTGTHPYSGGFGQYSMNIASPFWPQRSGLLPGFDAIVDATGGQYEGFNYFGAGGLLLIIAALILERRRLGALVWRHRFLCVVFACATVFALSYRVYLFDTELLDVIEVLRSVHAWPAPSGAGGAPAGPPTAASVPRVLLLAAVFRSSGRMFWIVYYAAMLFGLALVLRRLSPGPAVGFVAACCLLQLVDTNPLRARLSTLTRAETPTLLDLAAWEDRARGAARVHVDPSYVCSGEPQYLPNLELELAAVRAGRPVNSVYNPRLAEDCAREADAARNGPWQDDTLYVFLAGPPEGVAAGWMPSGLACQRFAQGVWCLGREGVP
jgi:hypothetical protein